MSDGFTSPRGTNDILPDDIFLWQDIEDRARRLFRVYNYQEIRTPLFEETELFARSMGQTSDVVQKQMLHLASQKSEPASTSTEVSFSLRPENTASIARAYTQHALDKKRGLAKLYYLGAMFRGERPQKGRLRQFHQIGAEAIGPQSASPYLDAEMIALSLYLLKQFGIREFQLKINTLGTAEDKERFSVKLRQQLKPYLTELSEYSRARFERNVFRILDSKEKADQEVMARIRIDHSYLSDESRRYYEEVKKALDALNIEYMPTAHLVRGLDYYTHIVFEITSASLGSQDALGAGGRYNNLIQQLGGPSVDAIGFALGVERIILALGADHVPEDMKKENHLEVFVIAMDEPCQRTAFHILNELRQEGIICDMDYRLASLKSQMRLANKFQAKYTLILGSDELKDNELTLKDMATGDQKRVPLSQISRALNNILKP